MYLEEALRVLLQRKMRSFLTIVGLVIGVAAVISIQVVGSGMAGSLRGTLSSLDDRSFVLFPKAQQRDAARAAVRVSEMPTIVQDVPEVTAAAPAGGKPEVVHVGHQQYRLIVYPDSDLPLSNQPLSEGRAFTAADIAGATAICILSNKAYTELFPSGAEAIGRSIYAGGRRYVVIGIQAPPRSGILNVNFAGDIAIPYTLYAQRYLPGGVAYAVRFTTASGVSIEAAAAAVEDEVRKLHRLPGLEYQRFDKQSVGHGIDSIFGIVTVAVALLGGLSLLVAGIGIMNIMLVSVTERVREIGIRKAIGARRGQIMTHFVVEALALSLAGCSIGLTIGVAAGWLVNRFAIVALTGYVTPIPWLQSVTIAVVFATGVTLTFGTYPAYRAARLDPIQALRAD